MLKIKGKSLCILSVCHRLAQGRLCRLMAIFRINVDDLSLNRLVRCHHSTECPGCQMLPVGIAPAANLTKYP